MKKNDEGRRHEREVLETPQLGIVYPHLGTAVKDYDVSEGCDTLVANVINRSSGGLLMESSFRLEAGSLLDMRLSLPNENTWIACRGQAVWCDDSPTSPGQHVMGIEFKERELYEEVSQSADPVAKKRMYPSDLEFLTKTSLLETISEEAKVPLFNVMVPERVKAGKRIVAQGDEGDCFYIIQEGTCVVNVEKGGVCHPIARLRVGDIVGEMAILTGERRVAHADAETDMKLWRISKPQFDELCTQHLEFRDFLSEVVTDRFSSDRLTVERTIGKYVINSVMNRGGWSIVYGGVHRGLNMPVAIKMLKHDMAMDRDFSEKFRNEAKTIARLNHENIVQVYDIEDIYKTVFIVMECLDGSPLDHILERIQRLPVPTALNILMQTCAGLDYAHQTGIVHQDIKPANIFVLHDDRVKIVDFGLSCHPGDLDCGLRGTIFYASPEAVEGDPVDERTDIYSLGIMAYEMVTGQKPFIEDDLNKMIEARLHEDIPDPRLLVPDLPYELRKFIVRATQRDPAKRYRRVSQALLDLESLARKIGGNGYPKRKLGLKENHKMISLLLFFQDDHEASVKQLLGNFHYDLRKIGAEVRSAEFKDL